MATRITRIGNSRGIRIPKALLDLYGLAEGSRVDLTETREGTLIKRSSADEGRTLSWRDAYAEMAQDAAERAEWLEWDATASDGVDPVTSDSFDDQ